MITTAAATGTNRRAYWSLNAAVFLGFLSIGILVSGVPRYLRLELGADRTWTGLGATIYFVGAIVMRPFAGRWIDRRGPRWFLTWPPLAVAVCIVGLLAVREVWWVVGLRVVQGAIASGFSTAGFVAATDLFPPERRATAVSRISLVIYVGFIFGPVLADLLIDIGYPALFFAAAAGFVGVALVGWLAVPPRSAPSSSVGATPPAVLPRAGREPIFQRAVVIPGLGSLAASFLFAAVGAFHPEYAERMGISRAGTLFAAYALSVLVVRMFVGGLADRLGPLHVAVPGMFIAAAGAMAMALAPTAPAAYVAIVVTGLGVGVTFPALTSDAVRRVDPANRGSAMGSFMAMGDAGQALAGPVVGFLSTGLGFRWVYGTPAVAVALGGLLLSHRRAVDARVCRRVEAYG